MKIRSGFVSNSSSASFVIVGFEMDLEGFSEEKFAKAIYGCQKIEDRVNHDMKLFKSLNRDDAVHSACWDLLHDEYRIMINSDDGLPKDMAGFLGKVIAEERESYIVPEVKLTIHEIQEIADDLAKKAGLNICGCQAKVITGTRAC